MGSFNMSDFVTGESIKKGARVVGMLISYQPSDLAIRSNPSESAVNATDRYKLSSLPMRGSYADFGGIHFDEAPALPVLMAQRMTGLTNAASLCEYAVGFQSKVQLLGRENKAPTALDDGNYTRTYGLAVMHEATFDRMVAMTEIGQAQGHAKEMFDFLEYASDALETAARDGVVADRHTRSHLFSVAEACSLRDKRTYFDATGRSKDAPMLSRCLSAAWFSDDFVTVVEDLGFSNLMYKDPRKPHEGDGPLRNWTALQQYFESLWASRCLVHALNRLGRELLPSRRLGQRDNTDDVRVLLQQLMADALQRKAKFE